MISVSRCGSLVLGTAQLGSIYGIANKTGRPDQDQATSIIKEAWDRGISEFDTARQYSESENVLGRALAELGLSEEAKVITKFYADQSSTASVDIDGILQSSLKSLEVPQLYAIMLHNENMLSLWDSGMADHLRTAVADGRVKHVGVSVHSPSMALKALNTEGVDLVQLPANILDSRFEKAGAFKLADETGKTIYIRSVFLQGLILMDRKDVPERISFALPVLDKLEALRSSYGMSMQELALGYVRFKYPNAKVLFGADTSDQVRENCLKWETPFPASFLEKAKGIFDDLDDKILNPALWPQC